MKNLMQCLTLIMMGIFLHACTNPSSPATKNITNSSPPVTIAFMPDVHFHDIYGDFANDSFEGIATETIHGTEYATIRSMQSQLQSTRLFNENYFAFIAALDDVVKRNIKYVALPGDFSDDGQPIHMRGLKKVLDKYHREHGIEFFATNGNHDPVKPFSQAGGKSDYLGDNGKEQPVFSPDHSACKPVQSTSPQSPLKSISKKISHKVICSEEVQELGYEPIMELLGRHGFYPKNNYIYFETPYSTYTSKNYSYSQAETESAFAKRRYEICNQGTADKYKEPGKYKQQSYTDCTEVPDSSYLVEPVPGVWLLAVDANVYVPFTTKNGQDFSGSGDAGYNKVISHKTHLIDWIADVVKRANEEHKTLIAFSHFPMEEFYDGASDDIEELFGKSKFQLNRKPTDITSKILADTGLKVHVGGHMHMNDTGVFKSDSGNTLFNIQAPSLAAYAPAYKLLRIKNSNEIEVETIVVGDVPRFKELFPLYQKEWDYLNSIGDAEIWNKDILQSDSYYTFADWHLRELARLRFFPKEWPIDIRQLLSTLDGRDMLILSQLDSTISLNELLMLTQKPNTPEIPAKKILPHKKMSPHKKISPQKTVSKKSGQAWQDAVARADKLAAENNFNIDDFGKWNGKDLSVDFFRLCNAGQLALKDISKDRINQYRFLAQEYSKLSHGIANEHNSKNIMINDVLIDRFGKLLAILMQFSTREPDIHFLLNIKSGEINAAN